MFTNLAKRTGLEKDMLLELTAEKIQIIDTPASTTTETNSHIAEEKPVNQAVQQEAAPKYSSVKITATKTATILLLDNLGLCGKLDVTLERHEQVDEDTQRLYSLLDYLEKRPNCNFNNVLGYWGGLYGLEAQQKLARLVANQFLGSAKSLKTYDPKKELEAAFSKINELARKPKILGELAELRALGLENLNEEQKNRLRVLVSGAK